MARPTPFHSRTSALCTSESWVEWSGYLSANSYEVDHMREYHAVRTSCAVFDISPLYKYHIGGRDAARMLDRVVTRNISQCRVGQVLYTGWCDDDGKLIDDGTVARLEDDLFRLTAAMPTLDWLLDNAFGFGVEVEDQSEAFGALALQGPTSRDLLQEITDRDLSGLRYFQVTAAEIAGVSAHVSRTGFTGDLGYEIFVAAADAEALWDAIAAAGDAYGLRAAGNTALEMARIEAGLLLIDVDFVSAGRTFFEVQKSTPFELGLGWTVQLDKPHFIGQEALRREQREGPAWRTVGLVLDIGALEEHYAGYGMPLHLPYTAWTQPVPVYSDTSRRHHVGRATSGTWSPVLKQYVAIARIEPEHGQPGARVHVEETIEGRRHAVPAAVVEMPFFDPPRKRAIL